MCTDTQLLGLAQKVPLRRRWLDPDDINGITAAAAAHSHWSSLTAALHLEKFVQR